MTAITSEGIEFYTGTPSEPGEYQASMDPPPMPSSLRYYWNGRHWSMPYHTSWASEQREQAKAQISEFQANRYWRRVD